MVPEILSREEEEEAKRESTDVFGVKIAPAHIQTHWCMRKTPCTR